MTAGFEASADRARRRTFYADRDEVVAVALGRRGEMIRANLFVEITCLEVEAQNSTLQTEDATTENS